MQSTEAKEIPLQTILVIDDNKPVRDLLIKALTKAGYQVVALSDGVGAVQTIRSEAVDLLVTDIVMPNKEGIETIEDVRAAFPGVPVIAISSNAFYLQLSSLLGVNAVIEKPIQLSKLLSLIKSHLN